MSEQKYYVKLKPSISVIVEHDDQDNEIEFGYGYLNGLHEFSPLTPGNTFTKSELAEVMNGAFYTQTDSLPFEWLYSFESLKEKLGWEFNETIDKWEYYNPMIELIPVEEIKNV